MGNIAAEAGLSILTRLQTTLSEISGQKTLKPQHVLATRAIITEELSNAYKRAAEEGISDEEMAALLKYEQGALQTDVEGWEVAQGRGYFGPGDTYIPHERN